MEKLVIIGSGSGGIPVASTVAKFRKNQYDITVITKDRDIAYSPCGIPFVFKGDIPSYKDLIMHSKEHYRESGIKILTNTSVREIDSQLPNPKGLGRALHRRSIVTCGCSGVIYCHRNMTRTIQFRGI